MHLLIIDKNIWWTLRPTDRLLARLTQAISMLMVFVMVALIPKIGLFPVSPVFFLLLGSLFLFFLHSDALLFTAFKELPHSLLWFLVLVFMVGICKLSASAIVICFKGIAAFSVVFCLMTYRRGTALWTTRLLALFYIASAAWMISSTFIYQPFATVRQYLYAGHMERFNESAILLAYPTGFTFAHFAMGYQLSVGIVLTVLLSYFEKGTWKLLWLAGSIVTAAAIILSGQRSVIPAVVVAFGIFLIQQRRLRVLLLIVCIAKSGYYLVKEDVVTVVPVAMMSQKMEHDDYLTRFTWQLAALHIIAERPMGNIFGEMNWQQEALDQRADFTYYGGAIKAVHNAYLGNALDYGWPGAALVLLTLWYILRCLVMKVFDRAYAGCPARPYALICVLALISVMVQALFHNSNLFTVEPSTWIIFSVASAWIWLMRREKRAGW